MTMSHLLKSTLIRSRLSGTCVQRGAIRTNSRRFFASDTDGNKQSTPTKSSSSPEIVDTEPKKKSDKKKKSKTSSSNSSKRLPSLSSIHSRDEFPRETRQEAVSLRRQATQRMMHRAWLKVSEPPTLHLLAASAVATFGIAGVEATLLCTSWPWESLDTSLFVARYAVEQVFPSIVWQTQPAELVLRALDLPTEVLRNFGDDAASASILLHVQRLQTSRHLIAGFMMIAQLVRAAGLSSDAVSEYQKSIRRGREPPLLPNGLVTRLCGVASPVTELSSQSMGRHLFPVYENPEKVQFLLPSSRTTDRKPVYWCVHPGTYGLHHAWHRFPIDQTCLLSGTGSNADERLLILEADATNENDPLGLGETALDLTLDDASQGFRRILEAYHQQGYASSGEGMKDDTDQNNSFRPLRVYLGNALEVGRTGGGHSYTLRHRVRYAKEVDVLLDSRAPVLQEILQWCQQVVGDDRRLFVQTSSRTYFLNLQKLLKEYGYEVYDPLDLRMMEKLQQDEETREGSEMEDAEQRYSRSLLSVLMEDSRFVQEEWDDLEFLQDIMLQKKADASLATSKGEMLRQVAQMSKIPRLVHYETTAQTVNAVQSLITAGQVDDATKCCALLDHPEGVSLLETVLHQQEVSSWNATPTHDDQDSTESRSGEMDDDDSNEEATPTNEMTKAPSVHIICSSSIHDRLFRQVRTWARMGYSDKKIQREVDHRFQDILHQSHQVQQEVVEDLVDNGPHVAAEQSEDSSSSDTTSETTDTEQTKKEKS